MSEFENQGTECEQVDGDQAIAVSEGSSAGQSPESVAVVDGADDEGTDDVAAKTDDLVDESDSRADDSADDADDTADSEASDDESSDDESSDDEDSDDESSDDEDSDDDDAENEGSGSGRSNRMQALDEEGDIAADYLEDLLDIAELDGDIDTYTEGGRAHVSLVTDSTLLVGRDGEVLEALQELSRLAVMTETGKRSRLMLDVAGHRDRRRRELTDLANDAVNEVKETGESVRLSPMNPFERKIVHDVVASNGLNSESEGEEPQRCVVVMRATAS